MFGPGLPAIFLIVKDNNLLIKNNGDNDVVANIY